MTPMPWQMSYAAVAENESAELQTDVMRFMAILAFCLVAIFAIVQSLPPAAPSEEPLAVSEQPAASAIAGETLASAPESTPEQQVKARVAAVMPPLPIELQRAATTSQIRPAQEPPVPLRRALPRMPERRATREPLQRIAQPAAQATAESYAVVRETPAPEPVPEPATAESAEHGLSLRFESDAVLRSLVQRGLVSLYAIDGEQFFELQVSNGSARFVRAQSPGRYHEMIADTVPRDIKSEAPSTGGITWGVTLPVATSQQLQRFVRTRFNGELVITRDAQLALGGKDA